VIVDKIEGYEALRQCGLHVARARYVDSAEDAIAFAGRRNAADDRAVPIGLRSIARDGSGRPTESSLQGPLDGHEAIRRTYGRLLGELYPEGGKVLAQDWVDRGSDVAIEGRIDAASGKVITLRSGAHSVECMVPVAGAAAEALVHGFREYHHQLHGEHARRMLEHLLIRISEFFEHSSAERLVLDPVRLHENSYTIVDATLHAPGPLHLERRLGHHAHDRKGYDYHPAGRQ
jgi:hypothetical protein